MPIRSIRRAAQRRPMPTDSWRGGAGRGGRGRPGFPFVALIAFLFAVGNVALLSLVVVPLFSVSPTTASTPLLLSFLCAFVWWLRAWFALHLPIDTLAAFGAGRQDELPPLLSGTAPGPSGFLRSLSCGRARR